MIEYNRRQVPTIVQASAQAVSWCAQLFVSACEHADTIPYSDQHTATLIMSSLSWLQHMFCCIRQSILIYCQYFWHIFSNVFFVDPAIVGQQISALCSVTSFPSKCIWLIMPFNNLHLKKLHHHFLQFFETFGWYFLKLALVGIVVLCWWPKAISLPVMEVIASAGRHGRQDGLEDSKVSLIYRLKALSCE